MSLGPLKSLGGALEGAFDRLLCVVGAVLFSQVPEFIQQYLQRLGGHLDEARRQLERISAAASQSGLTVDQLSLRASGNADPALARLGSVLGEAARRVDALAAAERAIRGAPAWARPFVFLGHLDPAIARATGSVFRPAVPTTLEGLAYALAGMAILVSAYHFGVRRPVGRALAARAARRRAAPCH